MIDLHFSRAVLCPCYALWLYKWCGGLTFPVSLSSGWTGHALGSERRQASLHAGWRWRDQRSLLQPQQILAVCRHWAEHQDLGTISFLSFSHQNMFLAGLGQFCDALIIVNLYMNFCDAGQSVSIWHFYIGFIAVSFIEKLIMVNLRFRLVI